MYNTTSAALSQPRYAMRSHFGADRLSREALVRHSACCAQARTAASTDSGSMLGQHMNPRLALVRDFGVSRTVERDDRHRLAIGTRHAGS